MYVDGGKDFMSIIYLMWIIVFGLTIRSVILYLLKKNPQKFKRTNNSILFTGSFAFLVGITGQMVGLMATFDSIQKAGDTGLAPQLIAGGLKVTFIAPFFGLMLLLISAIIWFVFRNLIYTSNLRDS